MTQPYVKHRKKSAPSRVMRMVDLFVIVPMAGNQSDAMMRVVRT